MKRIVSLILTLAMVLSLMAGITVGVSAEEAYTYIEGASITGTAIPELAVGDALPALEYSVPADANYTVSARWYKNGSTAAAGTAVEEGNVYQLEIKVVANTGYAFAFGYSLLINGEEHSFMPINARGEGVEQCWYTKKYPIFTPIDKVELSYDEPVAGQPLSDVTIAEGALYTAGMDWYDYDDNETPWKDPGTIAEMGHSYFGDISASPAEGYMFTEDTEIWVNGERITEDYAYYYTVGYNEISIHTREYNLTEFVAEAYVTYTEPVAGQPLPMPVAGTGNYAVDEGGTGWWDYTTQQWMRPGDMAQKGHIYYLDLWVAPAEGYEFAEDTELYVNGELVDYNEGSDGCIVWTSEDYALCDPIAKVELTYSAPVAGQVLADAVIPAGVNYTVESNWYDYNLYEDGGGWVEPNTVALKGHRYDLQIILTPAEGYAFTQDAEIWINGVVDGEAENDIIYVGIEYHGITIETREYNLGEPVAEVYVTYTEPVAGQVLADAVIPAGVNYTVESYWYDYNLTEDGGGHIEPGAVAVKGHKYDLEINIYPAQGYMFTEDTAIWLNGELLDDDSEDYWENDENYIYIDTRAYMLGDPVAEVRLTYAEPVLGQVLPTPTVSGEGVELFWNWYDSYIAEYVPEGTVAEKGHRYSLDCYIITLDGYKFTEDTKVYVNGELQDLDRDVWFDDTEIDYYSDIYSFCEKINAVSLNVADPVVGQPFPEIAAPEGVNYEVYGNWWDARTEEEATGTVQVNGSYDLYINAYAKFGYEFAEDVVFTVNGQVISTDDEGVYIYSGQIGYEKHYTFATQITKVELPAIPELKVGDALPEGGSGDGYSYAYFFNRVDGDTGDTIVSGGTYVIGVVATANEGYEFAKDVVVTVGGKPASTWAEISYFTIMDADLFSFGGAELIREVNINTTIPTIGQSSGGKITFANAEGYRIEWSGWGVASDSALDDTDDLRRPLQAGQHVVMGFELSVKEGYYFAPDVKIIINGKEYVSKYNDRNIYYLYAIIDMGEAKEAPDYNGLTLVDGVWGYYEGGVLQVDYTGLVPYEDNIFYVENGILDFTYTGLVYYMDEWRYVANSQLTDGYTGLVYFNDNWFYTVNSRIDWTFTGLVPYEGNYFYVQNNLLDWSYTGLGYHEGEWYFIQNGLLKLDYTGLVYFNETWFYVENGHLTWDYTGLVEYEGNQFYVQNNVLDWAYTGLGYHDGGWYYIENALLKADYNGLVYFNDTWFYIENGALTWATNGLKMHNGDLFLISGSVVDWTYNGPAIYEGTEYNVINGFVDL